MPLQPRIGDQFRQWITEALVEHELGDIVSWDVGLAALPEPATVGQFVGFMIVEVMIPGEPTVVDGTQAATVVSSRGLLPPFAPREQVVQLVNDLLADLQAVRDDETTPSSNTAVWTPETSGTGS